MVKIGVIGGGQLARMMVPPAVALGLDIKVLAETEESSAAIAATMVGDYNQLEIVRNFAKTVDVITFDHEHVPLSILETLVSEGVAVHPSPTALRFSQNKLEMRRRLGALNLPMPAWAEINTREELQEFLDAHGGEIILKTPIGGYDGKGVRVVRSVADAEDWFAFTPLLAEEKVEFTRELAQLSARSSTGEFRAWPLVQTVQLDGVCAEVLAPAPDASAATLDHAVEIAQAVAEGLDVTGVLAVEMFETTDGRLVINELAMRPHNSGHFSIEGSVTSQFEQHLRAVSGLPLGSTDMTNSSAVMINLLGVDEQNDFVSQYRHAMQLHPHAKFHTYGKSARPGRKMGHVTVVAEEAGWALAEARAAAAVLRNG